MCVKMFQDVHVRLTVLCLIEKIIKLGIGSNRSPIWNDLASKNCPYICWRRIGALSSITLIRIRGDSIIESHTGVCWSQLAQALENLLCPYLPNMLGNITLVV